MAGAGKRDRDMPATAMRKNERRVSIHDPSVNGTAEFTDGKLQGMKTAEVALLVAAVRGGADEPKPKDKAAVIAMFWKAIEAHPEKIRKSEADAPKAVRKGRLYSVVPTTSKAHQAAFDELELMVKRFVESLRQACRPLIMTECAALLSKVSKTGNAEKHAAWIFSKRLRPAGLLAEDRG